MMVRGCEGFNVVSKALTYIVLQQRRKPNSRDQKQIYRTTPNIEVSYKHTVVYSLDITVLQHSTHCGSAYR